MALPADIVTRIRRDKENGLSLNEIAYKYNCAKSTASFYCRDVFWHPFRKYATEREARQTPIDKKKGMPRKRYPSDFNKPRYTYPCIICGAKITRKGRFCIVCYTELRKLQALVNAEEEGRERAQRIRANIERQNRRMPKATVSVCPKSPNERHYWVIDSTNIGACKYCEEIKDFNIKPSNWFGFQ